MSKAAFYRERAVECQRLADAAVLGSVRETLQDVADKYLALAANEDRVAVMSGPAAWAEGTRPFDTHG